MKLLRQINSLNLSRLKIFTDTRVAQPNGAYIRAHVFWLFRCSNVLERRNMGERLRRELERTTRGML